MNTKDVLVVACKNSKEAMAGLIDVLINCNEIKIGVPCNILSNDVKNLSSRVIVGVKGRSGNELLLDCGSFWKGAPNHLVRMHYEMLLNHANDNAIAALAKKLQGKGLIQLPIAISRPQSRVGAISRQSTAQQVIPQNSPLPASANQNKPVISCSSNILFQENGVLGEPASDEHSCPSSDSFSTPAKGLHSNDPIQQIDSFSDEGCEPNILTPFKSSESSIAAKNSPECNGGSSTQLDCSSPSISKISRPLTVRCKPTHSPHHKDVCNTEPCIHGSRYSSLTKWAEQCGGPSQFIQAGEFDWLDSHRPIKLSCSSVPASNLGQEEERVLHTLPQELLSFSSSDVDDDWGAEAGAVCLCPYLCQPSSLPSSADNRGSEPAAHAAVLSNLDVEMRSQQPLISMLPPTPPSSHRYPQSQDEFDRVFFAPWSAVNDAATQTGTAGGGWQVLSCNSEQLMASQLPPGNFRECDTASQHFESFLQHFSAGIPHLAMATADLHGAHGTKGPIFVKAQLYMKTCLQIKEELSELMERHRASTEGA